MVLLLAALVLLPALIGFAVASTRTELYQGEADVYHTVDNPEFAVTDRLLASQELRAQDRALAEKVAAANDTTAQAIVDRLTVDNVSIGVNDESTVLRFNILDEDRDRARKLTQDFVDAYIASVRTDLDDIPGFAENKADFEELEEEKDEVRDRLKSATAAGDLDAQEDAEADYDRILKELAIHVDVWRQLQRGEVLIYAEAASTAWVTDDPVEPRPIRTAALGLLGGFVLAGAAIVLLRRSTPLIVD